MHRSEAWCKSPGDRASPTSWVLRAADDAGNARVGKVTMASVLGKVTLKRWKILLGEKWMLPPKKSWNLAMLMRKYRQSEGQWLRNGGTSEKIERFQGGFRQFKSDLFWRKSDGACWLWAPWFPGCILTGRDDWTIAYELPLLLKPWFTMINVYVRLCAHIYM